MKRSLTLRYTVHQIAYWASAAGLISFASAFLLEKGFTASQVGILLACGNLLSCAFQPLMADFADRMGGSVLKWLTLGLTSVCSLCFLAVHLLPMGRLCYGIVYLMGVFFFDAMNPLLNAVSVSYSRRGYSLNYGVARGIGSFAYAIAALTIGKAMAAFGVDSMIRIGLGLMALMAFSIIGYPMLEKEDAGRKAAEECCSASAFFRKYRMYCVSLLGVLLLAMFHAMTENYLIEIVRPLGGDSGTVGVALFVATAIEMVVLVNFDRVRRHIPDTWLLKISGISFLIKSVAFLMAPNVTSVYVLQALQATSYTFLSPTQVYYAGSRVSAADMVKGQAFITAAYTLGCAIGNFIGGQLLHAFDVRMLMMAGVLMAAGGASVFFLTVDKAPVVANEAEPAK